MINDDNCVCDAPQATLQRALLALGEMDAALGELMGWLERALHQLDQSSVTFSEPKAIELDISMIKVSMALLSCWKPYVGNVSVNV